MSSSSSTHVVLFPFMSKGHTVPIFDLARIFLRRNISVTIFTTPANRPFFSDSLSDTNIDIIEIPFPQNIDGIPPDVESTDKLPTMSLFHVFANATKSMKPQFEHALESLSLPVTFMVTDGFLSWTLDSANKFNIPRFVYYGMSTFASSLSRAVMSSGTLQTEIPDDEPFDVADFSPIMLTKNDFESPFRERDPTGPVFEFVIESTMATTKSHGLIVNSFYQIESRFVDYYNRTCSPKAWCVGPFCAATEPPKAQFEKPQYMTWLDERLKQGKQVLYVAFGSQAEISTEQFNEIKIGLEKSEVNFLWVVRRVSDEPNDGFEERTKNRGLVINEWVNQRQILSHESVKGFLSHCGWNSVIESICAKVPILGWPMMAEQHLNVRMVVEVMKIGLRVETCDGSVRGFVKWEGLEKSVRELMEGERVKEARKKVMEVGEAAINAVKEGGSSCKELDQLIHEVNETKLIKSLHY